ncbi:outer membrane receptor protein involved in Fe transport [Povalibacter uvarum]|uniref:Outer membrane receptor protein involved in Fe transport n=1 Tax=Povalibacter uvarum TaxID=732238 RepID=A0A841HU84_9GAMM|nr:TonB-dependent receptor [Povalibacter uvarum]MBB6095405.1 outer membrane receptor protein involved in Fe transport [Povalibacter uvarum]
MAAVLAVAPSVAVWAADSAGGAVEEVIVTAQRRAENIQRVPIAVTAVTADQLEAARVDSIDNVQAISPSISFDVTNSASNSANIRIRGIGTVGNSRAFEGAVGVFIDGVYRTRGGQALQNWLDVDNLQVLRGPQGTLFGKNTSAGALLLTSKQPEIDAFGTDFELTYGNYETLSARAALNAPLSDSAALRIAGLWGQSDGFIENPNGGNYNDRNPRAVKAQLLLEPTDSFSLRVIADWSDEKNNCCYGQVDDVDGPLQPLINNLTLARGVALPSADFDDYEQVLSNDTQQDIVDKGVVVHADWDLQSGDSLHSVTAYRSWQFRQDGMDADFTGANVLTINESFRTDFFSQEFTYNGSVGDAEYVVGAYFADEDIEATYELIWGNQAQTYFDALFFAQAGLPPGTSNAATGTWNYAEFPATSRSYAAFTHWTIPLSDPLKLVAGLRYSSEDKTGAFDLQYFTPAPNAAFRLLGVQPGPEYSDEQKDEAVSGTFGFQYQFTDDVMGYLTYSRGFKAGGVNIDNTAAGTRMNNPAEIPGAVPKDPTYKPEFIDGYELGLKTQYADGRGRTNFAVFYDEMKDLQVAQFLGTQFTIVNAPEATVYGAEIENSWLLGEAVTLGLDATWLPEKEFGEAASILNLSGRDFAQAPDLAANLSLNLDQPLTNSLALIGRAAAQYTGEVYTNTSNDLQRDAQTEYNLSLGLRSLNGNWSVTAWCQNCSDERYVVQHFNTPLQGTDANGYVSVPLTYGLTLRVSF